MHGLPNLKITCFVCYLIWRHVLAFTSGHPQVTRCMLLCYRKLYSVSHELNYTELIFNEISLLFVLQIVIMISTYSSIILKCWSWLLSVRRTTTRSRLIVILYIWVHDLHCTVSSSITYIVTWGWPEVKAETCCQIYDMIHLTAIG